MLDLFSKEIEIKDKRNKQINTVFDMLDALSAPVITYPSSWNTDIPRKVIETILPQRIISLMNREYLATIPECVTYIMPASLAFPLNNDWTQIYLYVCTQYVKQTEGNVPQDIEVNELDAYQISLLNDLRYFIYRKRREYLKSKLRLEKVEQNIVSIISEKPSQLELF